MLLGPGESLILQEPSRLVTSGGIHGTLSLTSQRLVFEAVSGGSLLGGAGAATLVNLELERIWNLHAHPPVIDLPGLSQHILTVEWSAGRHSFGVTNPNQWGSMIGQARAARPPPPPPPPLPPPPPSMVPTPGGGVAPIIVQVMTQPAAPAQPVAPAIMIRCRYCGSLSSPTSSKCASCGAGL